MLSDKQKKHILVNRDGLKYYTFEGLEKVHEEMLRLLLIIDTIAKENNIPYWIDGGSLIGIVRHKGFIPWDNDGDITMYREAYEKFLKCAKGELKKKGYFLKWTDRVPKVCLLEREEIHVDIFFIDPLPKARWKL